MAKENEPTSSYLTFQKVIITIFSSAMIGCGAAFVTMQKSIAEMSVQINNQIKQLDTHIANDKIVNPADVMAVVRQFKIKE